MAHPQERAVTELGLNESSYDAFFCLQLINVDTLANACNF